MIIVILLACVGLFILSLIVYLYSKHEYNNFIHKMANENTIEHIDEIISEDEKLINTKTFKGYMLESLLDHKELWEQIKKHKMENEDTVC